MAAPHQLAPAGLTHPVHLEPLLSPDWYRVAALRPQWRASVQLTTQRLRGETWFVLSDPVSGRHLRFNNQAFAVLRACDGQHTLDAIWAARLAAAGDNAPTQGETIALLAQAFGANLLSADVPPDAAALMRRHTKQRQAQRAQRLNPLAFRVPLWDPNTWLDRVAPRLRWCFSPAMAWLAALLLAGGALLLAAQAEPLADALKARWGQGRVLLLVWLAYPPMKALHELAHALAVKHHGGAVHEVGLSLLALNPVPYVDASAASAFGHKRQRMAVAGAGILVEALLATLALALWVMLAPGLARDVALAVVVVGVLSTLLVNGNPLLPFDGYHLLCDAAELPNLGPRSSAYWRWLLKHQLLRLQRLRPEPLARGERAWLLAYAPLAWAWRSTMLLALASALAQWSGTLGLLALAWGGWLVAGRGLLATARWLHGSPELQDQRARSSAVVAGLLGLAGVLALAVPLQDSTRAPGVVWLPDDAQLRLDVDGTLLRFVRRDGEPVAAGDVVAEFDNPTLQLALAQAQQDLAQAKVQRALSFASNAQGVGEAQDDIQRLQAQVQALQQRVAALPVRARLAGRLVLDTGRMRPGQYLSQGDLLAQVLPTGPPLVRALVRNEDIALVRGQPGPITVQLAHGNGQRLPAELASAVPQASTRLPSPALGDAAGGPLALDAADTQGLTAREPFFQFDLRLPANSGAQVGARVMVRFNHGQASPAALATRWLRQAFLRHFER